MSIGLIIAYVLTFLVVLLPITTIPQALIGGLIGRLTQNVLIGMLIGSIIIWLIIDLLWVKFVDGHIPVLAFGLCFLTLVGHSKLKELNDQAKFMIGGEQWALVLLCIYTMIVSDTIRWY